MLVGSRHNAHVHLLSRQVSKAHALIVNSDRRTYIHDLASRTHVLVNGVQVECAILEEGDELQIGGFVFRYVAATAGGTSEMREAPAAQLVIEADGTTVPLFKKVVLIGRRPDADVPVLDPTVSTAHAVVFEMNGQRWARDLGSRTGTLVNDQAVKQIELHLGDRIRIGPTEILYTATEQGAAPAAALAEDELLPAEPDLEIESEIASEPRPVMGDAGKQDTAEIPLKAADLAAPKRIEAKLSESEAADQQQLLVDHDLFKEKLSSSATFPGLAEEAEEPAPAQPTAAEHEREAEPRAELPRRGWRLHREPAPPLEPGTAPDHVQATALEQTEPAVAEPQASDQAEAPPITPAVPEAELPLAEARAEPPASAEVVQEEPSPAEPPPYVATTREDQSPQEPSPVVPEPQAPLVVEPQTSGNVIADQAAVAFFEPQPVEPSFSEPPAAEPEPFELAEPADQAPPQWHEPQLRFDEDQQPAPVHDEVPPLAEPLDLSRIQLDQPQSIEPAVEPLPSPQSQPSPEPLLDLELEPAPQPAVSPPELRFEPTEPPTVEPAPTDAASSAEAMSTPPVEVIEETQPTPDSALSVAAVDLAEPVLPTEPSSAGQLTDTTIGHMMHDLAGSGIGEIVEGPASATLEEPQSQEELAVWDIQPPAAQSQPSASMPPRPQTSEPALPEDQEPAPETEPPVWQAEVPAWEDETADKAPAEPAPSATDEQAVISEDQTLAVDHEPPAGPDEAPAEHEPPVKPREVADLAEPAEVSVETSAPAPSQPAQTEPQGLASMQDASAFVPPAVSMTPPEAAVPQIAEASAETATTDQPAAEPAEAAASPGAAPQPAAGIFTADQSAFFGGMPLPLQGPPRPAPGAQVSFGQGQSQAAPNLDTQRLPPPRQSTPFAAEVSAAAEKSTEPDRQPLAPPRPVFRTGRTRTPARDADQPITTATDVGDVFAQVQPPPAAVQAVLGEIGGDVGLGGGVDEEPTGFAATPSEEQPLEEDQPQRPKRRTRPPLAPPVPPSPEQLYQPPPPAPRASQWHRRTLVLALLGILLVMALAAGAIWYFMRPSVSVKGVLRFERFAELPVPRQRSLQERLEQLVFDREVRQAVSLAQEQAGAAAPLEPTRLTVQLPSGAEGPTAALVLHYRGHDRQDVARLRLLIDKLYEHADIRKLSEEAASLRHEIASRGRQVSDLEATRKLLGDELSSIRGADESALQSLQAAQQTALDSRNKALAEHQRVTAQLDALMGSGPAAAATMPSVASADPELQQLEQQLAQLNQSATTRRAAGSQSAHAARRELDQATQRVQESLGAVQATARGNLQLAAYVAAAQRLHQAAHQFSGTLLDRQKTYQQRLSELKQQLDEAMDARRQELWASDAQLKALDGRLELATRQYNAASAANMPEAARLKKELEDIRLQVTARRRALGEDQLYSRLIATLKQSIDAVQKQLEADRREVDQTMQELEQTFSQSAPAVEKLPQEHKALTERLRREMEALSQARRAYAQAVGPADQEADSLRDQLRALHERIAARRQELSSQRARQLDQQQQLALSAQKQQLQEQLKAAQDALEAANRVHSQALMDCSAAEYRARRKKDIEGKVAYLNQWELEPALEKKRQAEADLARLAIPLPPDDKALTADVHDPRWPWLVSLLAMGLVLSAVAGLLLGGRREQLEPVPTAAQVNAQDAPEPAPDEAQPPLPQAMSTQTDPTEAQGSQTNTSPPPAAAA